MPRILTYSLAAAIAFAALIQGMSFAGPPEDPTSVELGSVKWNRDYEAAKKRSAETGKPLLLFFQEVPG